MEALDYKSVLTKAYASKNDQIDASLLDRLMITWTNSEKVPLTEIMTDQPTTQPIIRRTDRSNKMLFFLLLK